MLFRSPPWSNGSMRAAAQSAAAPCPLRARRACRNPGSLLPLKLADGGPLPSLPNIIAHRSALPITFTTYRYPPNPPQLPASLHFRLPLSLPLSLPPTKTTTPPLPTHYRTHLSPPRPSPTRAPRHCFPASPSSRLFSTAVCWFAPGARLLSLISCSVPIFATPCTSLAPARPKHVTASSPLLLSFQIGRAHV